jgi:hypothetical protein
MLGVCQPDLPHMQALNKNGGHLFTHEDEMNLKLFGTHLGNTLAKAKLHEHAR